MKMTLLEMTQNILAAIGGDAVNSIADTQESWDVSNYIKETYDELFSQADIPELKGLVQLEGLGDISKPNYMKIPENVASISWIKYKDLTDNLYTDVKPLTREQFLDIIMSSGRDGAQQVTDFSGATFLIENNKHPSYWTTFDDRHIIFDSYNQGVEATVHQNNSLTWGTIEKPWAHEDDFIPPIDPDLFPRLLAESKSVSFVNIKNITSAKEEQRSRRHLIKNNQRKFKLREGARTDFSRKR
jgi:hypothetical protein